ncbi:MAG: outer membrane protein [Bacteroidota bacterium]|jgi:peptidoglycan-associated lipoprotein|nr:OmpA family protein [Bacteroidota bacterium]
MPNNLQASIARFGVLISFGFALVPALGQDDMTAEADRAFERRGYYEAAREYVAIYAKIKDVQSKAYCAFQAGEAYRLHHQPAMATEWYDKAIGLKYGDRNNQVFLVYGDALRDQELFDDAIEMYSRFDAAGGDSKVAEERIEKADLAALMIEEPESRYIVEPMVILNSESYEYAPTFGEDGELLVFASSRESSAGTEEDPITGQSYMDLFQSTIDKKGRWSEPEPVGNTICTEHNEGGAALSSDGKTIYFTRCVEMDGSNLACDIYFAQKQGRGYGATAAMGLINRDEDDSSQVGHPALSPDDRFLVFASDMPGGLGGKDLWFVEAKNGSFAGSIPQNLGSAINTAGDDMFPHFRSNGDLYWATNGREGLGQLDIWKAEAREGDLAFAEAKALPFPINGATDDFAIAFRGDTEEGMFTSNRPGGKGQDDLYSFRLPPLEFCYQAYVYDYDTGMPLSDATLTLQGKDGSTNSYTTDGEGEVSLCEGEIGERMTFNVNVAREGYIGTGDLVTTEGLTESTTLAREYLLKEIVLNKEYDMPVVLYPLGSAELLVDDAVNSKDSLNYLVDLLERNENLVIQLEAHTDSRGSSAANKQLSQDRAETCVQYLIERGIPQARMVAKGYGEDALLVSDAEIARLPESEREMAHQRNRRTVFKIIRFDYKPGE